MSETEHKSGKSLLWRHRKACVVSAIIVVLALLPLAIRSNYILHVMIMTLIYTIVTVSFRTIYTSGQFALAHAGYMGIGAYLAGMASKYIGWSPWLSIILAALAAAGIGMLIGWPFSRLRTLYYALGSLFFGLAIVNVILATRTVTGGSNGLTGIPRLFNTISRIPYYYFFLALAVVCVLALYRFEHCRIGRDLKAIDQSHMLAQSVGINEGWYRILVLGVGCFFAGIAGATYAHYSTVLSYNTYGLGATLWIVMYCVVGGIKSFYGPILGTIVLIVIPEASHDLKLYTPYVTAALALLVIYLLPSGLAGLPAAISSFYRKHRREEEVDDAS
ncbi:MAG: branched-chain amino acid ABC transporter permease [Armatimonadetes bacterium]|nr:branched-chain amino acid ABC transporter permease [Armatimonadota bacterium]